MKENSIEEDIALIEKSLCDKDTIIQYHYWVGTDFLNAVERIVADYKRVLKENEELLELKVSASAHNRILELEKENNRLEEQVEYDKTHIYTPQTIELNFILKSKIEDKIEELKKKVEELTDDKGYWGGSDLLEQIKVLQELLEKEQ